VVLMVSACIPICQVGDSSTLQVNGDTAMLTARALVVRALLPVHLRSSTCTTQQQHVVCAAMVYLPSGRDHIALRLRPQQERNELRAASGTDVLGVKHAYIVMERTRYQCEHSLRSIRSMSTRSRTSTTEKVVAYFQ
jgi:hypothetical protein